MTSAPASASIIVQYGPLIACDRSRTRMPSSGGVMSGADVAIGLLDPDVEHVRCAGREAALDRRPELARVRHALAGQAHGIGELREVDLRLAEVQARRQLG